MNIAKLNRKLQKKYRGAVSVREEEDRIVVSGRLTDWNDAVEACTTVSYTHLDVYKRQLIYLPIANRQQMVRIFR